MAKKNFPQIMAWLAQYEGGFVDHPRDPGGATNRGVTQRVYTAFRKSRGLAPRSVRDLTAAEHNDIYTLQYWRPVRGDDLPSGLDATVFDFAVNSGVARSAKTLQKALGVTADGIVGEITLGAIADVERAGQIDNLIISINNRRMKFLRALRHWPTFKKGWTWRVVGLKDGIQPGDDIGVLDRSLMLFYRQDGRQITEPQPRPTVDNGGLEAHRKAEDRDMRWIGRLIEAFAAFVEALFSGQSSKREAVQAGGKIG